MQPCVNWAIQMGYSFQCVQGGLYYALLVTLDKLFLIWMQSKEFSVHTCPAHSQKVLIVM